MQGSGARAGKVGGRELCPMRHVMTLFITHPGLSSSRDRVAMTLHKYPPRRILRLTSTPWYGIQRLVPGIVALLISAGAQAAQVEDVPAAIQDSDRGPGLLERPLELARELAATVDSEEGWYIQGSVWTTHFDPQPDHNNNQDLIGLERHRDDSYLWGAATFRHSFGERSWYGYTGKRFEFAGTPFNAKLTAGLLYGYRGEYRDKIPFNRFGVAPAVISSVGASYQRVGVDVVLLGAAAAMVNVGVRL